MNIFRVISLYGILSLISQVYLVLFILIVSTCCVFTLPIDTITSTECSKCGPYHPVCFIHHFDNKDDRPCIHNNAMDGQKRDDMMRIQCHELGDSRVNQELLCINPLVNDNDWQLRFTKEATTSEINQYMQLKSTSTPEMQNSVVVPVYDIDNLEQLQLPSTVDRLEIDSYGDFEWLNIRITDTIVQSYFNLSQLVLNHMNLSQLNTFPEMKRLKHLELRGSNLNKVPTFVAPMLETLDLSLNPITTFKDFNFNQYQALQQLNIAYCTLSSFPQEIDAIPHLKKLNVSHNDFSIMDTLPASTDSLIDLAMDSCSLNKIPTGFENISTLEQLDLSNNPFGDISMNFTLPDTLQSLRLRNTGLTAFPTFLLSPNTSGQKAWELLDISENFININNFKAISFLETNDLYFQNMGINAEVLAILSNWKVKRTLSLSSNDLSSKTRNEDVELAFPRDITELHLENCSLSSIPKSITNLNNLKSLSMSNNPGIASVSSNITLPISLTSLSLERCSLNGEISSFVKNLSALRMLHLDGNQITKIDLSSLIDLEMLSISNNNLTKIPNGMFQLNQLHEIDISGNPLMITTFTQQEYEFLSGINKLNMDMNASLEHCTAPAKIRKLYNSKNSIQICVADMGSLDNSDKKNNSTVVKDDEETKSASPYVIGIYAILILVAGFLAVSFHKYSKRRLMQQTNGTFRLDRNIRNQRGVPLSRNSILRLPPSGSPQCSYTSNDSQRSKGDLTKVGARLGEFTSVSSTSSGDRQTSKGSGTGDGARVGTNTAPPTNSKHSRLRLSVLNTNLSNSNSNSNSNRNRSSGILSSFQSSVTSVITDEVLTNWRIDIKDVEYIHMLKKKVDKGSVLWLARYQMDTIVLKTHQIYHEDNSMGSIEFEHSPNLEGCELDSFHLSQRNLRGDRNSILRHQFLSEIKVLLSLMSPEPHANIVRVLGVTWSSPYDIGYAVEYIGKGTIRDYLQRTGVLGKENVWSGQKLSIALGVAEGLMYLHCRTLKVCYNHQLATHVLLNEKLEPKLSNFENARVEAPSSDDSSYHSDAMTTEGEALDVYAFGLLLLEMDCHCPPSFVMDDKIKQEHALTNGNGMAKSPADIDLYESFTNSQKRRSWLKASLLDQLSSTCPQDMKQLVSQCLSTNAHERPSTVEIAITLRQIMCKFSR